MNKEKMENFYGQSDFERGIPLQNEMNKEREAEFNRLQEAIRRANRRNAIIRAISLVSALIALVLSIGMLLKLTL